MSQQICGKYKSQRGFPYLDAPSCWSHLCIADYSTGDLTIVCINKVTFSPGDPSQFHTYVNKLSLAHSNIQVGGFKRFTFVNRYSCCRSLELLQQCCCCRSTSGAWGREQHSSPTLNALLMYLTWKCGCSSFRLSGYQISSRGSWWYVCSLAFWRVSWLMMNHPLRQKPPTTAIEPKSHHLRFPAWVEILQDRLMFSCIFLSLDEKAWQVVRLSGYSTAQRLRRTDFQLLHIIQLEKTWGYYFWHYRTKCCLD